MRTRSGGKTRRFTAEIISILILAAMLFSAFYVIAEADHECSGHDCPVCACLQQCDRTLHQVGSGITAQSAVIVPFVLLLLSFCRTTDWLQQTTPVQEKVRLND